MPQGHVNAEKIVSTPDHAQKNVNYNQPPGTNFSLVVVDCGTHIHATAQFSHFEYQGLN